MLAFAKDISQNNPKHSGESENSELKEYMDYQRALDHERLIYSSLDYAKTGLQESMTEFESDAKKLDGYLKENFPLSFALAGSADTVMLMLRKLVNGHNSTNNWYRMNAYYHALVFDCMKRFVKVYNRLVQESPEKAKEYRISEGIEVDFDDWTYLYFLDLDFHVGKALGYTHYPFAKRNKAIEEEIDKKLKAGDSFEDALKALKEKYEIDDVSIKVLLGQEIGKQDLELFYTSVENPIYEAMTQREEGRWGLMDGESFMDQAYYLGSSLKVWVWRKREEAESAMEEMTKLQKK